MCDLKALKCAFFSDSALIRRLFKLDFRLTFHFKYIKRRKSGLKTAQMKRHMMEKGLISARFPSCSRKGFE